MSKIDKKNGICALIRQIKFHAEKFYFVVKIFSRNYIKRSIARINCIKLAHELFFLYFSNFFVLSFVRKWNNCYTSRWECDIPYIFWYMNLETFSFIVFFYPSPVWVGIKILLDLFHFCNIFFVFCENFRFLLHAFLQNFVVLANQSNVSIGL